MTVIECADEKAWHAERRKSLGGSDAPALFGLGYKSAFRVALEKMGKAEPQASTEEMEMGQLLEPVIRQLYEKKTGRKVTYPGRYVIHRHDNGFMHASLDGLIEDPRVADEVDDPRGVLQCKMSNSSPQDWEEGSDLRLSVEIQLHHEMMCAGANWGSAAILCTHFRQSFFTFDVERNRSVCSKLEEKEKKFWEDCQNGVFPAPDASQDTHSLIRKLHPNDKGTVVNLGVSEASWFAELESEKRIAAKTADAIAGWQNKLQLAIGDNTFAVLPDGTRWSYRTGKNGARTLRKEWSPVSS